ncbi:MAG: response regulator [Planctomycetes bacterium]|nr:response regulator [Planctomycetota bacterium]
MTLATLETRRVAPEALTVLLVDDDRQLLRTLSDLLRRCGYAPRIAESGREALDRAIEPDAPPAIALIDMRLPDMDGMEVVRQLREQSRRTEVVILTGHATVESAVGALRQQSCDYLVKPVAPPLLLDAVGRAADRWLRRRAEEELSRGEERFRRLIEGIGDVLFLLDDRFSVGFASPSLTRVLGWLPAEVVGRPLAGLFAAVASDLPERLRALPAGRTIDLAARHRDGSERTLQVSTSDLLDHPEVRGFVVTARDVSEQRRLEVQALQAQRLDSVGRLAGGIAHDFNNVLSVILGASDLALAEATLPAGARGLISDIRGAAGQASRLVRQLLSFARRAPCDPTRGAPLRDLVEGLAPLLQRLLGESIELRLEIDAGPHVVRVDAGQLEQLVMNLAVNARDAMPDGGLLSIEVRGGEEWPQRRDHVELPTAPFSRLVVTDTGTGMTEEVRSRALEPFFTTKEPGRGTGLGLSICYGIVRAVGGSVAIASAPGRGTRVELLLPAGETASAAAIERRAPLLARGTESILLVEDDASVRRVLTPMLRSLGYQVTAAADGSEGLALLREQPADFALVVSDVAMPRMSGPRFARAARELIPELRFVFLSGWAGRAAEAIEGDDPLLGKPVQLEELARTVRAMLDRPARPR